MNLSNLPVFYSKEYLTDRLIDYSNVYLLPIICLFGILASLVCLFVSSRKRDHTNTNSLDYILINSLLDLFFLITQIFLFIIRCGAVCPFGYTLAAKIYELYIYLLIGYIFVTCQVLFNIYVAYNRLRIFSAISSSENKLSLFKVTAICTLISTIANSIPYAIAWELLPLGIYQPDLNSTYYEILWTHNVRPSFQTPVLRNLLTILLAIKIPVLFIVLCAISIAVCFRFRVYLKSKKQLVKLKSKINTPHSIKTAKTTSNERKENNLTFLTIVYCIKIILGNFIDSFTTIAFIFSFDIFLKFGIVNIIGNILLFASHGISFFLYYFFYNVFRENFVSLFRIKKSKI